MIDIGLLLLMLVTALGIVWLRSLFAVVMFSGIFSLTAAALWVVLDAVDVAFTEASVGAGIATVLGLASLALTRIDEEKRQRLIQPGPLLIALIAGAALIYGTFDMPVYGDPNAPINRHVAPRYVEDSLGETGVVNIVTSVLASYRGYDTLGETTVIFTAATGVLVLLGRGRRRGAPPAQRPAKPPARQPAEGRDTV